MFAGRTPAWIVAVVLVCILLYAALLRLDALFKSYGPYEQPRWLAAMQPPVRAAAATLTPDWRWPRDPDPYAGGDPINYLKFAREMRNFYAAHVREPGFPAATRLGLVLTGNEDVGISLTTIAFAVLAVFATFLLGWEMASPLVGLGAAAALAIDQVAVIWSIEGWRDEMFAFLAVMSTWAWLRLYRQPTTRRAVVAGVVSGGMVLTRITSISLLAPAMLALVLSRPGERALRNTAVAASIMFALAAPFLINCAIATGDPLYAIDNHTVFYLGREGVSNPRPISAIVYASSKFSHPIAATDTMVAGVLTYPFTNKWVGLDRWYPNLGRVLSWLAIGGVLAWLWQRDGRFVLFMFLGALIPFSATWTVRGGAEWRLTLFAYSFYLIAAFWLVEKVVRNAGRWRYCLFDKHSIRPALVVGSLVLAAVAWHWGVPYAVASEALKHGDAVVLYAGARDRVFFVDGWGDLNIRGNVTERVATGSASVVRMPLPDARPYRITMRIDPLHPEAGSTEKIRISLNGEHQTTFDVGWDPDRVGEYQFSMAAEAVHRGANRLELQSARPFRLWYVQILPQ